MSIASKIVDPSTNHAAKVTEFGQLVVAPIAYSDPVARNMNVAGVAFNFAGPTQDQQIVITDILVSADRNVSNTTPANIEIYEADAIDSIIPADAIMSPQLIRASNLPMTGLNLIVQDGKCLNAKTDDANILLTIMFYKVPVR